MRRFLLLFHVFFAFSHSFPVRNDDRGVLPNIDALFCTNKDLRQVVFNALQNITNPKAIAVDQVQAAIQTALIPNFASSGGTWLVSATSYHRVNGYVDDRATSMDTFCAVNDINLSMYIVIMKIDK
ncbi:Ground-like domain-containing protein [Caenorhabditis elegans]|uniref:Ground-like domain-containing protein n=1 Tax=Caenorhabditis elegans TaxID=6239 RepID=A0A9S1_CAEEL|nr:Ground-like domain-containing protein [Caenorhabditis elegans]CCD67298.2 Ground-like domain-containing protein [Caenorhabditis elegans]|eukprot:NP_001041041.2 Uncharacterized protein CELE_Y55F3BR.11 [Caenorhabditis elegans]